MSSTITDYFSPKPKRSRMDRCDGDEWSEEEWFQGATQQYVEDRSYTGGALVDECVQPQLEDTGMEEFILDDSFDEWTASFIGRESLGCGGGMNAKEVEVRDVHEEPNTGDEVDDDNDLYTAEGLHSEDPSHLVVTEPDDGEARIVVVGDQDEAHASQDPEKVTD